MTEIDGGKYHTVTLNKSIPLFWDRAVQLQPHLQKAA